MIKSKSNGLNFSNDEMTAVLSALDNSPTLPFSVVPFTYFAEKAVASAEKLTTDEITPGDFSEASSIDLFDETGCSDGAFNHGIICQEKLPTQLFLDALEGRQSTKATNYFAQYSDEQLLACADEAIGFLSKDYLTQMLREWQSTDTQRRLESKRFVSALIVSCLSEEGDVPTEVLNGVVDICSDVPVAVRIDNSDPLPNLWGDVFSKLISLGRFKSLSTVRLFRELMKTAVVKRKENASEFISILVGNVKTWTESVVNLLLCLLEILVASSDDNNNLTVYVNEFDLKSIINAFLIVVSDPELQPIAGLEQFYNVLSMLVPTFPSFFKRNADFSKIIAELIIMSKAGKCSNIPWFKYRRLLDYVNKKV